MSFTIGVIISTYNNPLWLKKTLWGYTIQERKADEIIIADDGSDNETEEVINSFKDILPIKHVWHKDNGFRKCMILNKAITESVSDYLIFTDQDCIPRKDFIYTHAKFAQDGYFLSGGYFKLPMSTSKAITQNDIHQQKPFQLKWLFDNEVKRSFKCTKLINNNTFTTFMNFITPAKASWNGCNSSTWRKNLIEVNGFNEDMLYGGEDRELGERLFHLGIHSKQIRYSAIIVHLDHNRPYKSQKVMDKNNIIRQKTKKERIIQTPNGINKLD